MEIDTRYFMGECELTKIGPGFYRDRNRSLYFKVREFLDFRKLPDSPKNRQDAWNQVNHDFGALGITELPDDL